MHARLIRFGLIAGFVCGAAQGARAQTVDAAKTRMVLIDQDASGPGGSDQMAMMELLQSPRAKVLGITVVTGDQWAPEEVAHTLRMLELIHRTDVPVVRGAVFPLVRTEAESMAERAFDGSSPWWGAWTQRPGYHGPFVVPPLAEGEPTTKPLGEDAAHFLIRQVRAHPHEVTIYAAGPLTNIALALTIDPEFAQLTQGIVMMGGSIAPQTDDPEFATNPRHEFNFWFDPEAAHIVLRAAWPRIELTTTDVSVKTRFTREMVKQIQESDSPAARYVATYSHEFGYLWDELAAAAWLDPKIVTREQVLYVDVDLARGPDYGNTLTWTAADRPQDRQLQPVRVQEGLDTQRFYRDFVELMKAHRSKQRSTMQRTTRQERWRAVRSRRRFTIADERQLEAPAPRRERLREPRINSSPQRSMYPDATFFGDGLLSVDLTTYRFLEF